MRQDFRKTVCHAVLAGIGRAGDRIIRVQRQRRYDYIRRLSTIIQNFVVISRHRDRTPSSFSAPLLTSGGDRAQLLFESALMSMQFATEIGNCAGAIGHHQRLNALFRN